MDHTYIQERNLAALYLQGKLSPEERAEFEEHFLDCPQCIAEIEATREFRDGLKQVTAKDASMILPPPPARWPMYVPWTAVFVLMVACAWLGVRYRALTNLNAREGEARLALERQIGQRAAAVRIFSLVLTRSADASDTPNRVILPSPPQYIILSLDRSSLPDLPDYRARIEDSRGQPVWTAVGLQPVSPGTLGVGIHSSLLHEGSYVLVIEGVTRDGRYVPDGRYPFRAVP